ncbi:MAG: ligase-associated DNA damage response exonuclease [Candidatus Methylacidiphilales bacterium]
MISEQIHPNKWLKVTPQGLYCTRGDFHIDASGDPVSTDVVTHGHADHARSGHGRVIATPETIEIMKTRYGADCAREFVPIPYGGNIRLGEVEVGFEPAGHILGSAQIVMDYAGQRVVCSGDYKRRTDPTCQPFTVVECDVFITEATFGLPVFCHPDIKLEVAKLVESMRLFPQRCHVVGVYSLGKCQRLIMELRAAGFNRTIFLHGALLKLCELYQRLGVDLGEIKLVTESDKPKLGGELVLCPPSAINDRWARKMPDVVTSMASGWMQIRARAKQKLVELPLVVSDHSDWDELLQTIDDVRCREVWVTHGREEALIHALGKKGIKARALSLVGYEEEDNE